MNHPNDEFLACPALAINEHGRVDGRHTRGQFQHLLHRHAPGDEVLRRGVARDSLAKHVQFPLTLFQGALPPSELLQSALDGRPQPLHLLAEILALKILA